MSSYAIGLDYGTNSCRALLVDLASGEELAQAVYAYQRGVMGVVVDARDPHVARQSAYDYVQGMEFTLKEVLRLAAQASPKFKAEDVVGIGVDTTGSTPIPVDAAGQPLEFDARFKGRLAAQTWLWKDHTSYEEAAKITEVARKLRPEMIARCGGVYSSEWFWAKIWKCLKADREVFDAAFSWVELCDWLPAVLCGVKDAKQIRRGVCAAGHKAMFDEAWGGLPDKAFLAELDPKLAELRDRLYDKVYATHQRAGVLGAEWAAKTGLKPGIAVAIGAFDAHMGAVGAGIRFGSLVKIVGTSTCDIMLGEKSLGRKTIPGVCGMVHGSVIDGTIGIEAGQSAVGDLLLWWVMHHVPEKYGATMDEKFKNLEARASAMRAGQTGLLALDWNNGNRTVLVDQRLSGLLLGQTLLTESHEIYRALVEATAFGALTIIDRIESYGQKIAEVINCGGLAHKNRLLMQIYADVTGRPMKVAQSDQTCALGAAIFAGVAAGAQAGGFESIAAGQAKLCRLKDEVFMPRAEEHAAYRKLYALYSNVHDSFGMDGKSQPLFHVMKDLAALRDQALQAGAVGVAGAKNA